MKNSTILFFGAFFCFILAFILAKFQVEARVIDYFLGISLGYSTASVLINLRDELK